MRQLIWLGVAALPVAAPAQVPGVTPGEWDIAITTNAMTMADMPPEMIKSMVGRTMHVKHCITPAEAMMGPQSMLRGDKSCSFTKYQVSGGRLHAEMSCKQPGGMMNSVSDGTYTSTGFTVTGKTVLTGSGAMTMSATTVGTRTGACTR